MRSIGEDPGSRLKDARHVAFGFGAASMEWQLNKLSRLVPASVLKRIALTFLLVAAGISLAQGLRNAYRFSNDLQWSGTRLLVHHVDPYSVYLAGDPSHALMQWQIPNYLHELYIFDLPLGYLSFPIASCVWAAANLVFISVALALLIRFYGLSGPIAATFILLVLCSTAFRNSLGNGQQDILATLSFIAVTCLGSPPKRAIGMAGVLAKYNFAPVILGNLFAKRELKLISISFALPAFGYLAFLWLIHFQHPLHLAIEPFLVSRSGITPGRADLMTAIEQLPVSSPGTGRMLAYLAGMTTAVVYGVYAVKSRLSSKAAAAGMAAATLVTVKHVEYDLLLLIVPLAYFMTKKNYAVLCSLLVIGEVFYVDRWLPMTTYLSSNVARVVYMFMIAGVLCAIHYTDRNSEHAEAQKPDTENAFA